MSNLTSSLTEAPDSTLEAMFDEYEDWCRTGILGENTNLRGHARYMEFTYGSNPSVALQFAKESFLFECAIRWKKTKR